MSVKYIFLIIFTIIHLTQSEDIQQCGADRDYSTFTIGGKESSHAPWAAAIGHYNEKVREKFSIIFPPYQFVI